MPARDDDSHGSLTTALAALRGQAELATLRRGIEKESLRIAAGGDLATTPHPRRLGSPLTHPHITTDFSEAQLELITGVHNSATAALAELSDIHRFVYANIGGEQLWTASMPCLLGDENAIPIARFGTSNAGRSKTIYRIGLSHRYGRRMQTISGIHYNFSLPEALWPVIAECRGERVDRDFIARAYFGLIRNFRRYSWLLIYLFGASPAVCRSFLPRGYSAQAGSNLATLDEGTLYLPWATSLRMGRLGYQSDAQASLHISYNSLAQYAETMRDALTTPYPAYEAIGMKAQATSEEDEYRQLSTALLQIENEFYGTIRPKRRTRSGERPLAALHDRGVEYVELRCLDLDPFQPLGIDATTCRVLDVFLLYCLLDHSPPDSRAESTALADNQLKVVERGREPGLTLAQSGQQVPLRTWAEDILGACMQVANVIDAVCGDDDHAAAVAEQQRKVERPELTPSAKVLAAMRDQGVPFFRFALTQSETQQRWFAERPLPAERNGELVSLSEQSLRDQAQIESSETESFDSYLKRYIELPAA